MKHGGTSGVQGVVDTVVAGRIYAILKARSSIVLSEVCRGAPQLPRNSYPTIDLGACWTRHFEGGLFLVAIFSLYARISVSVTNSGGGGGGGTHLLTRPEIIVLRNEKYFRAGAFSKRARLESSRGGLDITRQTTDRKSTDSIVKDMEDVMENGQLARSRGSPVDTIHLRRHSQTSRVLTYKLITTANCFIVLATCRGGDAEDRLATRAG